MQKALKRTAWIAGLFSLLVLVGLVANAFISRASDPKPPSQIDQLVSRLNMNRKDAALMKELRQQDLWLRTQYLRSQRFAQVGAILLVLGVGTFLLTLRAAEKLGRKPSLPEPDAPNRVVSDLLIQQRGVLALGLFLGGSLTVVATLSRHDTVASYARGGTMPSATGEVQPKTEQGGTPLAVLPAPAQADQTKPSAPLAGAITPPSGPTPLNATTTTTNLEPLPTTKGEPIKPTGPTVVTEGLGLYPADSNWTQFRGTSGVGLAVGKYPTSWSSTTWKVSIPLPGRGSPTVWGDKVFFSGATATDRAVYCHDLKTGKEVWAAKIPLKAGAPPMKASNDAGFAPATVAVDADVVVAVFVNGDVVCFDHKGKGLWGRSFGELENNYGHSSSPVIAGGRLYLQVDQGGAPDEGKSVLYAVDPKTGKDLWSVKRPVAASWATPLALRSGAKTVIVTASSPLVMAYDGADGKELWRAEGLMGEIAPSLAYGDGHVFAGQMGAALLAIDASNGKVLWNSSDASLPDIVSPAYAAGFVFVCGPDGTVTAVDGKTGKNVWEQKLLKGSKGSPVVVGDLVYLADGTGVMHVFKAAAKYEAVATTPIGEPTEATPAFVGGRIIIRTEKSLMCVGAA